MVQQKKNSQSFEFPQGCPRFAGKKMGGGAKLVKMIQPLKFNIEFTREKWWERKTFVFPIGFLCNFSGVNSLLNFGRVMDRAKFALWKFPKISSHVLFFYGKNPLQGGNQPKKNKGFRLTVKTAGSDQLPLKNDCLI